MTWHAGADFDVVIVGSGPAGVSAAFPLVQAGLRVLMVDGGRQVKNVGPQDKFLHAREHASSQWEWMIGRDLHALRHISAASPKLRVSAYADVFDGFKGVNRIQSNDFMALGSLAAGGLSNAWGCGVACFSEAELSEFPFAPIDILPSYEAVVRRIGVSGAANDDLAEFFGVDAWSQPPVRLDQLQTDILERYWKRRKYLLKNGFRLGRSRVAALTEPLADRRACDRSGNCLWGCNRRALYSATEDLRLLARAPGFNYRPGFVVQRVTKNGELIVVEGSGGEMTGREVVRANRVLLAAGTLASTRLALLAIQHRAPVSMQSCPTAAFMLWMPRHLGRRHSEVFALGQLSFSLDLGHRRNGFGSLFSSTGIPVTEVVRHMPFGKRYGVDLSEALLTSCTVGNFFLSGELTEATLQLSQNEELDVRGEYKEEVDELMRAARRRLSANFLRMGAFMVPSSFIVGQPGSDIHYSSSLPMRAHPRVGETDRFGELVGAPGVHVVDGASLSSLPAKSHTLTIMANADRIARHVVQKLSA